MKLLTPFRAMALAVALVSTGLAGAEPAALEAARAAMQAGDLTKAATLLGPSTDANGTDAAAFALLGQIKLAQHDTVAALTCAERAVALTEDNADYQFALGQAQIARMLEVPFMQRPIYSRGARKALSRAIELNPRDVPAITTFIDFRVAMPQLLGGNLIHARELAENLRPIDLFLCESKLGLVDLRDENYSGADEHYQAALKLKPKDVEALVGHGRALTRLHQKAKARRSFEAALKVDPTNAAAKKGIADLNAPEEKTGIEDADEADLPQ